MPAIGFALNEALAAMAAVTGLLALAWWWQRRRGGDARQRPWWVRWGADFFFVVALIFGVRVAVADWMVVPTGSMEPTLRVGDRLLINHFAYGPRLPFTNTALPLGRPQRGDIVVFRHPQDVSQFLVKRLVGVAGDQVRFRRGVVSVNGEPARVETASAGTRSEDFGQWLVRETVAGSSRMLKLHPQVMGRSQLSGLGPHCTVFDAAAWDCTVPPGHLLMLGDNRDNSADSRVIGFVPEREVYGRVDRVLFNLRDASRTLRQP